jgi:flagellar biosynthesis repressor protein FlbT
MALKLSLKPSETFIVNGAVMQNGNRRGVILLQNQARVLREKDVMREAEANTPWRRLYFAIMLHYLAGETSGQAHDRLDRILAACIGRTQSDIVRAKLVEISALVAEGRAYRALVLTRRLCTETEAGSVPAEAGN